MKSSSAKGLPTVANVLSNKLIRNENCVIRTEAAITSVLRDNETTVILKNNKKMKVLHIANMLDPPISFKTLCKDSLDTWAKVFCLETIRTGVNKQVPNNASIEFYQTVMEGIRSYHNTVSEEIRQMSE